MINLDKLEQAIWDTISHYIPDVGRNRIDSKKELRNELRKVLLTLDIQKLVDKMSKECGFTDETIQDKIIELIEEVGELSHAIRIYLGLKRSKEKSNGIDEELADCAIYLIDIANYFSLDLEKVIRKKIAVNIARHWLE